MPPRTSTSVNALFRLVVAGDRAGVRQLLALNPGLVHATGPHPFWGGRPQALHVAVERHDLRMVRVLLQQGANPGGQNHRYMGWSPLLLAITSRQPRMVRLLRDAGAKANLAEALAGGDDRQVRTLLATGRRALRQPAPNRGAYLAFARTPQAVKRLVALGELASRRDAWGVTPVAALSRLGKVGKPLVEQMEASGVRVPAEAWARLNDRGRLRTMAKADPNVITKPTVIKAAVEARHHALTRWLLAHGADPDSRSAGVARETCLHSAAWNGDARMVDLLLSAGADPLLLDGQYKAPPSGWAMTSAEVTRNARCRAVARRLGWRDHG